MPDSNPLYDLMGGYYPGEPLPRQRPKYNRPTPFQINSDAFVDNYMNAVKKDLEKAGVSRQAKKLFIDDLERAFVVQVQPKKTSYDPMRSLELGDEEDVAGVQVKVDINPVKWIKDPKKMLKETGSQYIKDMLNWSDFDSYAEINTLWDPLLKQNMINKESGEVIEPGSVIKYAYGDHIKEGVDAEIPPFRLYDTGSKKVLKDEKVIEGGKTKTIQVEKDTFSDVAASHKKFIRKVRSSGSRNSAFGDHVVDVAKATSFELKQLLDEGAIADPAQIQIVKDHLHRSRIVRYANSITGKGDSDTYRFGSEVDLSFKDMENLAENGELLYGQGLGTGMSAVSSKLESFVQGKTDASDVIGAWDDVFDGTIIKARTALKEADDYYKSVGGASYSEFVRDTKPFRNLLNDMEGFKNDHASILKTVKDTDILRDKIKTANLKGGLDYMKEKYSREGPIKGGLQRMNRKYAENHILNGDIADIILDHKDIIGSKSALNILEDNLRSYKREDFYDLLKKLDKDGLVSVLADNNWNLARKRLNGLTPQAVAQEALKRTHYLGLKIDPSYAPGGKHEQKTVKMLNRWIEKSPMFKNKQSVLIDGKRFNFEGNDSLNLAFNLYNRLQKEDGSPLKLTEHEFFSLLNGSTEILTGGMYNKAIKLVASDGNERKVIKQASKLRKWLLDHNDQLGLEIVEKNGVIQILSTKENREILKKLFGGLSNKSGNPSFIDFAQKFATPLEKFSQWSNKTQDWIFKKFKFLGTIAQTRNIISRVSRKFISETLTKIATKIFGAAIAAGTGIGAILVPIIEKLTQAIIKRVQDGFKTLLKKGFAGLEEMMEDSFQAMAKTSGIIVGVIAIVFVIPSSIFFSTLMASITPLDITNMSSDLGAGPGAIFDGDCDYDLKENTGLSSSNPIVQEAIKLTDPLEIGFWCIWNKHPDYPQFWNESRFRSNPNPSSTFSCADCLFWCTRLVIYSYRGAGYDFENELRSREQKRIFKDEHQYFVNKGKKTNALITLGIVKSDEEEIEAKDLEPGDVVFFYNPDRYDDINHVAIVSKVDGDTVETIHSNAGWKVLDLTIDSSGGVQDFGNLQVIGFGRW